MVLNVSNVACAKDDLLCNCDINQSFIQEAVIKMDQIWFLIISTSLQSDCCGSVPIFVLICIRKQSENIS